MNFFKSVFADDSEPESDSPRNKDGQEQSDPGSPTKQSNSNPDLKPRGDVGGAWSFGSLIKDLATRSESVIETYRRDLKEFGSGLKKEIEVAQGSLETVGHAIDEFGNTVLKGTAQIISQGKDVILAADREFDSSDSNSNVQRSLDSKRYSRFDAQVRAIQSDLNTYFEDPEDLEDYRKWKLGFVLEEHGDNIGRLFEENGAMESLYKKIVPNSVDHDTFWSRYFYRVHKLKQAEDLRANLVKRAISREEEEELSWDVDDDDEDEDEINVVVKTKLKEKQEVDSMESTNIVKDKELQVGSSNEVNNTLLKDDEDASEIKESGHKHSKQVENEKKSVDESRDGSSGDPDENVRKMSDDVNDRVSKESDLESRGENMHLEKIAVVDKKDAKSKSDEKPASEGKAASGESSKSSDEEEDLGWDEIEDLSSIDEKKTSQSGSPNRADLRKRLSAAEEEEDLSWDIEDDDEPAKS